MAIESSTIKFLNVDLDIESREPIDKIIEDFGDEVIVLHQYESESHFTAGFEIGLGSGDAESVIAQFCSLIYNLSKEARQQWDACVIRNFDVGYESGSGTKAYQSIIRHQTIESVAELGGAIVITIYPVYDNAKQRAPADPQT